MSRKTAPWRFAPQMFGFQREMQDFMEETLSRRRSWPGLSDKSPQWIREWTRTPFVDVYEEGNVVIVKVEIPGVDKEDIELTIDGDLLTIRAEKKKEEKIEKKDYYYSERSEGQISRTIELPAEVSAERVNAALKNGVLEIRLPRAESSKRREIKVDIQ